MQTAGQLLFIPPPSWVPALGKARGPRNSQSTPNASHFHLDSSAWLPQGVALYIIRSSQNARTTTCTWIPGGNLVKGVLAGGARAGNPSEQILPERGSQTTARLDKHSPCLNIPARWWVLARTKWVIAGFMALMTSQSSNVSSATSDREHSVMLNLKV